MKVIKNIKELVKPPPQVALALGNFDGLHLGHQALIREVVTQAKQQQGQSVVFSFQNHPLQLLDPGAAPPLITTLEEKTCLLERLGVDIFLRPPFTREIARMTPEEFLTHLVYPYLRPRVVIVGKGYAFGKERAGDTRVLGFWGKLLGYEVQVVRSVEVEGIRVSSSLIRQNLRQGKVEEVNRLLGRRYSLVGLVLPGHGRGGSLGYPTANLSLPPNLIPACGVYATWAEREGRGEIYPSVTNIGY